MQAGFTWCVNVHNLMKENPELMMQAFLDIHSKAITPDTFISLISTPRPMDENRGIVYDWFMEYLRDDKQREASLEHVLQFCIGLKRVPPTGLKDRITVKYLFTSPLPMAEACFCIIQLPTIHTDKTILFFRNHTKEFCLRETQKCVSCIAPYGLNDLSLKKPGRRRSFCRR